MIKLMTFETKQNFIEYAEKNDLFFSHSIKLHTHATAYSVANDLQALERGLYSFTNEIGIIFDNDSTIYVYDAVVFGMHLYKLCITAYQYYRYVNALENDAEITIISTRFDPYNFDRVNPNDSETAYNVGNDIDTFLSWLYTEGGFIINDNEINPNDYIINVSTTENKAIVDKITNYAMLLESVLTENNNI